MLITLGCPAHVAGATPPAVETRYTWAMPTLGSFVTRASQSTAPVLAGPLLAFLGALILVTVEEQVSCLVYRKWRIDRKDLRSLQNAFLPTSKMSKVGVPSAKKKWSPMTGYVPTLGMSRGRLGRMKEVAGRSTAVSAITVTMLGSRRARAVTS